MGNIEKAKELLADALLAASQIETSNHGNAREWEKQAQIIQGLLAANPDLADSIPHPIWHYLADADIRRDEPTYRATQLQELLEAIEIFRHKHGF